MTILLPLLSMLLMAALAIYFTQNNKPSSQDEAARRYDRDAGYKSFGKLQPADEPVIEPGSLVRFKGVGAYTTDAFFMGAGIYYIVCQFPPQTRINVDLMNMQDASIKTIASVSGFTTLSFSVRVSQKYCLHILTNEADAQWAVLIKPF